MSHSLQPKTWLSIHGSEKDEKLANSIFIVGGILYFCLLGIMGFFERQSSPQQHTSKLPQNLRSSLIPDFIFQRQHIQKDGKVFIVEFGDYECGPCQSSHTELKKIVQESGGKIQAVFRHFPLPMHKNARKASLVVEAAAEQGKFREMHNFFFRNGGDISHWEEYAKSVGLDLDRMKFAMHSSSYQYVHADMELGKKLKISTTPTFYLYDSNGEVIQIYSLDSIRSAYLSPTTTPNTGDGCSAEVDCD
jgi:protein-disulfide isomerase